MSEQHVVHGEERFDSFDIYCTHYKKIQDHEIEVGILIPKDLKPVLQPVFVKFHGGGCVSQTTLQCSISACADAAEGVWNMGVPKLVCELVHTARPP